MASIYAPAGMTVRPGSSSFALLEQFRSAFEGKIYRHRDNTIGNRIVDRFYEDLLAYGGSAKLSTRVTQGSRVLNPKTESPGIDARHGDGSFGLLVPGHALTRLDGYEVARGPTASVEIGAEIKIIAKAMSKNISRTISVLKDQAAEFKRKSPNAITLGIVGVNHAESYVSYEGKVLWATDGTAGAKHPIQEAKATIAKLHRGPVQAAFDELLILPFAATNKSPYPFTWIDEKVIRQEYGAIVGRVAQEYERRF